MEWKTIDTAPKDGTELLFWCKTHGTLIGSIPVHMAHYKRVEAVSKGLYNRRSVGFVPKFWSPLLPPPSKP